MTARRSIATPAADLPTSETKGLKIRALTQRITQTGETTSHVVTRWLREDVAKLLLLNDDAWQLEELARLRAAGEMGEIHSNERLQRAVASWLGVNEDPSRGAGSSFVNAPTVLVTERFVVVAYRMGWDV